jgi:membrane protein insertase Oxa1/YidC/SpoIIIJ
MSFLHTIIYLPIFNSLMWLEKVLPGHDLGLAIIIVTLVIRLILYVPTLSAIRSSRQMQSLHI